MFQSGDPGELVESAPPRVTLRNAFAHPFDSAIAAARTCYSPRLIQPEEVNDKQRLNIGAATFFSGHHTVYQHAHFEFGLENISRQFIWSFLHAHPFYNSEQVSQRYVEVKRQNFVTPPLEGPALELYTDTCARMMKGYFKLIDLLAPDIEAEYFKLYPGRVKSKEKWENGIHKRVLEAARYVLPAAT